VPKEQYGQSQIKEVRFTRQEIVEIVHENLLARMSTSYDFDYQLPIILHDGDELVFRFVQQKITREGNPRSADMRPMPKGE
jgi:hypothetical protein